MKEEKISVREIRPSDIHALAEYWYRSDPEYLASLGVDLDKLPDRTSFVVMLEEQLRQPYEQKQAYCIIWELDGQPVGHSNINKITFGREAYMHLHLWRPETRKQGYGLQLLRLTLSHYFRNFELQTLYCEPYARNPAPSRTLEKVGFVFEKEYLTIPGAINFEQPVKRWRLDADKVNPL